MVHSNLQIIAAALCVVGVSCSDAASADPTSDSKAIAGLWSGSWGGGEQGGVNFQPAIAELFIEGEHVELSGFRNVARLKGTVKFETGAKRMQFEPTAREGGQPKPKAISYTYEIKGDRLTLLDTDGFPISFDRVDIAQDPLGDARVELVEAAKINDAGDLVVSKFSVLRVGREGTAYYKRENRSLKTKEATVRLVKESGWKKVTIDEARKLIRKSTPVVIVYRGDHLQPRHQSHRLWKDTGSPEPDSEAVGRTFSRILRPGTLVFMLSVSENVPKP